MGETAEYLLGTNDAELSRLEFQHGVWRDVMETALDGVGIGEGDSLLDLGCGPGFLTRDLARRVGASGSVIALDESPVWHRTLGATRFDGPVEPVEARIEDADLMALLPRDSRLDAAVSRWVFSFLSDPGIAAGKVFEALRPGGHLIVQDYNHEGISAFPRSAGFEAVVRATRDYYAGAGGNAWVQGTLPGVLRSAGFEVLAIDPHVKAGGPGSPVFEWADRFFPVFAHRYEEGGLITASEHAAYRREWGALRGNPDGLFYSPMVVNVIARRPLDARGG